MKKIMISIDKKEEVVVKAEGDIDLYDILLSIMALSDIGMDASDEFIDDLIKAFKDYKVSEVK